MILMIKNGKASGESGIRVLLEAVYLVMGTSL